MAEPIPLLLGLQSSPGRHTVDGGGRLINAYVEEADAKGRAQFPVWAIEGLAPFATLPAGGAYRGGIALGLYGYVVSGTTVYKIDSAGAVSATIGTYPGTEPVFMARNRKTTPQIMLCSAGQRYLIESDAIATIADADLPATTSCCTVAGYFIATMEDGRFFISTIDEGTAWDAGDVATAESSPDSLYVAHARGQELLLFGGTSVEFWAHTGASAFPFERIQGTTLSSLGIMARNSVRDLNGVVIFVASDGTVRLLNGYSPERISTHDVERSIDQVADKDTIVATAYSIRGHHFYGISCASWSWFFDATTGLWHERSSHGETRWRGEGFVEIDGVRAVGDFESGLLYELDPDTYTEGDSGHLVWTIRTPPMHAYPNRLGINRLFIDAIPGVGLNSATDALANPMMMLRWSDNGGRTWSNQRTANVGAIGEFNKRVVFNRLGQTREDGRIFEIAMSAAVIRGLTGGAIDVELLEP